MINERIHIGNLEKQLQEAAEGVAVLLQQRDDLIERVKQADRDLAKVTCMLIREREARKS